MNFRAFLANLMSTELGLPIVDIYAFGSELPKPYCTYQELSNSRSFTGKDSVLSLDERDIEETSDLRYEVVAQFDVYGKTQDETNQKIISLINNIRFKYREKILDANFGIIDISPIRDNTQVTGDTVIWRKSVDITFDGVETNIRNIENILNVEVSEG